MPYLVNLYHQAPIVYVDQEAPGKRVGRTTEPCQLVCRRITLKAPEAAEGEAA